MTDQHRPAVDDDPPGPPDRLDGSILERRYRRLLGAYPARYRTERGTEIVDTYLDLAGPDRRWPAPGEVLDLLGGGLRQRLRAQGALGLVAGLPTAAIVALTTGAGLAALLLSGVEVPHHANDWVPRPVGPFETLGSIVWIGWLLAAFAVAVLPGRRARGCVGGVVLLTLAAVPASPLTGYDRPPLFILLPFVALGLLALALPDRPGRAGRLLPLLGMAAGAGLSFVITDPREYWSTSYFFPMPEVLAAAGGVMFGLTLLVGLGQAVIGDSRALWAAIVLATPAGLLGVRQYADAFLGITNNVQTWGNLAVMTAVVTALGVGLLVNAIAVQGARHRAAGGGRGAGPCPTCGHLPSGDQGTDSAPRRTTRGQSP